MTTKQIKSVIKKFPHSEVRVPFTYHHDYLRGNCPALAGWSRADIANSTVKFDNKELYALALLQIIDETYPCDIVITEPDVDSLNGGHCDAPVSICWVLAVNAFADVAVSRR